MSILKFLKPDLNRVAGSQPSNETDTVRKIAAALDQIDPERAKFIAAFAYILSRVARADLKISPGETRMMERIVMEMGGLPEEQAVLVAQMAKTQKILFGATEDFLVTREFNEIASHEQKLALLECLFAVSAADESISTVEDNEIAQVAHELRIEHRDFISIRSSFRDHLAVLKSSRDLG
ncbi:MAG: TerB family tellurite resistance protein [Acidobacteria bacterium]|nr:TerB family tellurite resistance protein [Acidobacteriota bacterium]